MSGVWASKSPRGNRSCAYLSDSRRSAFVYENRVSTDLAHSVGALVGSGAEVRHCIGLHVGWFRSSTDLGRSLKERLAGASEVRIMATPSLGPLSVTGELTR